MALALRNCPHYVAIYYGILARRRRRCSAERAGTRAGAGLCHRAQWRHGPDRRAAAAEWPRALHAPEGHGRRLFHRCRREPEPVRRLVAELWRSRNEQACCARCRGSRFDHLHVRHHGPPEGRHAEPRQPCGEHRSRSPAYLAYPARRSRPLRAAVSFSYGGSVLHTHLMSGAQLVIEDNFAFHSQSARAHAERADHRLRRRAFDVRAAALAAISPSTTSARLRYVTQAGGAMARPTSARARGTGCRERVCS